MQLTIQLTVRNKTVRPSSAHPGTVQASRSSRMMIWSDLSILAFVICHISHFTLRVGNDYNGSTCQTSLACCSMESERKPRRKLLRSAAIVVGPLTTTR